tara:strand:- start:23 stop:1114 length:1092 start_codon:yes stop_codon:yes gene_type:complete
MNWLRWISTPITAIWKFIVESLTYGWHIVKMSWEATKESLNSSYLKLSFIGSTIGFTFLLLSVWISGLAREENIFYIGVVLMYLPWAWSYAEIANLAHHRKKTGEMPAWSEVKAMLGNGMKAVKFLLSYVLVIIAMIILEIGFSLIGTIPAIGPTLLGLLIVPFTLASAIIIISAIIVMLGYTLLGAHLLESEEESKSSKIKGWFYSTFKYLKLIGCKYPDLMTASLPLVFFAYLIAILPGILTGGSMLISSGLASGIQYEIVGWNTPFNDLMAAISGSRSAGGFAYIGAFFALLSLSVLAGFVFSFMNSVAGTIYYYVYNDNPKASWIKRFLAVPLAYFALIFIIFLIVFIWNIIFGGYYYY